MRPANRRARLHTVQGLEHELRMHQAELEAQNEELRRTQFDLAAARDRFVDLYDFAPIGYFTLDPQGGVVETNLTGAAMLGDERTRLLKQPFIQFVHAAAAKRWQRHLTESLQRDGLARIELPLQPRCGPLFQAQLDCLRVMLPGQAPTLRVTLTDITLCKQAEVDRRIATTALESRESERRRVARELHEELGQRLSALKMDLSGLRGAGGTAAQAAPRLPAMLETVDEMLAMVRRMATDLRPLMIDDLGLNAAIDWLARDLARRLGIGITLNLDESGPQLGEQASIAVYRLLQEMLDHIVEQAQATDLHIDLLHRADHLMLTVQDNGTGRPLPDPAQDDTPVALTLHQHARLIGGRLVLDDSPGGGRRFTLRLPLTGAVKRG